MKSPGSGGQFYLLKCLIYLPQKNKLKAVYSRILGQVENSGWRTYSWYLSGVPWESSIFSRQMEDRQMAIQTLTRLLLIQFVILTRK
uniref:Transposase n=1 Tax=Steinernema glaseri TaxID=37863 RepID=A0A1I7Y9L1_9BILA